MAVVTSCFYKTDTTGWDGSPWVLVTPIEATKGWEREVKQKQNSLLGIGVFSDLPQCGAKESIVGGSSGLVVMGGGDSCSEGREFESRHHILDGHFSH